MEFLDKILGVDGEELLWYQMGIRAVITYLAVLLMVRIGNKRFLSNLTAHDMIIAIILGSIVSRGVTGNSPFFATLLTAMILVVLHSLLSHLALKNDFIGRWIKGKRKTLIENGKMNEDTMQSSKISKEDILTAARVKGIEKFEDINDAYLEKNGEISVIKK